MAERLQRWTEQAIDVAAEIRKQLDEATGKIAERDRQIEIRDTTIREYQQAYAQVAAEREVLRSTLLGEAELAEAQHEPHDRRGSAWWHASWREVTRHRSELLLRNGQLERWLKESGNEATRLQRELDRSREQNAALARQLAETERDYTEMFADREAMRGELERSQLQVAEMLGASSESVH